MHSIHLTEIDPLTDAAYVLLSNVYAKGGRLDGVSRLRTKLHDIGLRKQPRYSLIEQDVLHTFTCGDFFDPHATEIYSMLEEIERRLQQQELQQTSSHHSERLAVAFGLRITPEKSPIRIVNNLRIYGDCISSL
ncbi:pentatricopeptide repeat-containing protein At3g62890-like [Pistacia vera]|uniref:pentatricopeptide repeat-containing protein At3g62890-like n=1 Tax=Pistacia vera TaxID=55513 RepID=UPI001263755E|nr:pentatricopeptide repeat-containing protein At3g62890-like [Pistacia vera]